jgi:hypothetical protein
MEANHLELLSGELQLASIITAHRDRDFGELYPFANGHLPARIIIHCLLGMEFLPQGLGRQDSE